MLKKPDFIVFMCDKMDYESLLDSAYKNIKQNCSECERCEVKKPEGHFEGDKTIISNFSQIVTCLRRESGHLAKFLFKELAIPGEISGDRIILIKRVPSERVYEKIKSYAEKYVICQNCKKPDTEIIEINGQKFLKCMACGTKRIISD